jgi:hypothetical protein
MQGRLHPDVLHCMLFMNMFGYTRPLYVSQIFLHVCMCCFQSLYVCRVFLRKFPCFVVFVAHSVSVQWA